MKDGKKFCGLIPPMVTPLTADQKLDVDGVNKMVNHLISGGVDGIFLLGTTGEGPCLSYSIREELVKTVCKLAKGKVPVLAAISDSSMEMSIAFAKKCKTYGVAAVVCTVPYYIKLTQKECVTWYKELADRLPLPLLVYNMPMHTDTTIEPDTIVELASHPNIVGMKDSSSVISLFNKFRIALTPYSDKFSLFMGPDEAMGEVVLLGADGGVCTGANLWPKVFKKMYLAAKAGDAKKLKEFQDFTTKSAYYMYGLGQGQVGFLKGLKAALAEMGLIENVLTTPFEPLDKVATQKMRKYLKELKKMAQKLEQD